MRCRPHRWSDCSIDISYRNGNYLSLVFFYHYHLYLTVKSCLTDFEFFFWKFSLSLPLSKTPSCRCRKIFCPLNGKSQLRMRRAAGALPLVERTRGRSKGRGLMTALRGTDFFDTSVCQGQKIKCTPLEKCMYSPTGLYISRNVREGGKERKKEKGREWERAREKEREWEKEREGREWEREGKEGGRERGRKEEERKTTTFYTLQYSMILW